MIVITVKLEAEKAPATGNPPVVNAAGVDVKLMNTQRGLDSLASLCPGETVEHRLHLSPLGVIELQLSGWSK